MTGGPPPVPDSPYDRALGIIGKRGFDLTRDDMFEIELLMTAIPFDDIPADTGRIYESLSLIVNDPAYMGDIAPFD